MDHIVETLTKNTHNRTPQEKESLWLFFSHFPFFQDLQTQDLSTALFKECVNSLSLYSFTGSVDLHPAIYVILQGSLTFQSQDLEFLPKLLRKASSTSVKEGKIPEETIVLEAGSAFGDISRLESFSGMSISKCILAVLNSQTFTEIAEKHEALLLSKVEFLKGIEIFKNWSRQAIKNASGSFEKRMFRKNQVVYKEKDPANEIFIVSEGEFKITQKFLVDPERANDEEHEFGNTSFFKGLHLKRILRPRELQIVVKQKGDIFGYNEILSKIPLRECTCLCNTMKGELLAISEKEFTKRFSHPETLRVLDEQGQMFNKWMMSRVVNLKNLEEYKYKIAYTHKTIFKPTHREIEKDKSKVVRIQSVTPQPVLPAILSKIMNGRNRSSNTSARKDRSFIMFPTELSSDKLRKGSKLILN